MRDRFLGPLGVICAIEMCPPWRGGFRALGAVPQGVDYAFTGMSKKKTDLGKVLYLPVRSTKGRWHYDPGYIIPSCRVALGESL
jgi:hypothetical protein